MIYKLNKIKYLLIPFAGFSLVACGAAPIEPQEKSSADYVNEAMTDFKALEKGGVASGQTWFDLAVKARMGGDNDIAKQALVRAERQEFSPIRIGMERARINAIDRKPDAAVHELQMLFDAGFTAVGAMTGDPAINRLAGREDYDALISTMSAQAYPCQDRAEFKAFDFWVGEWDVALANGTQAGTNSIQRAERGCVILENWTSATGGTGMSINYLDKATDEWVQVWNAEGGSQINIRGGMTDEGMRLVGRIHYVGNDTTAPFRALFTPLPDGRVRQFFEQSNDDGVSWVPWFEGFYTRKR